MPAPAKSLIVKRTVTGLGLFTLKPIKSGKRIVEYTGPLVTNEEVKRRRGRYFFEVDEKYSIDGSPRSNTARYINHSCRPNCEAYVYGRRIWIYSKRDIKAGEQLTYNYGQDYFDQYIKPKGCKCEECR
ncbi:MAG TPA: SET domain-containing protein [Pyrinomonadaceae bacterium]|nr:SET domain-containing protein [Pyrinomonadaceae bacterium]